MTRKIRDATYCERFGCNYGRDNRCTECGQDLAEVTGGYVIKHPREPRTTQRETKNNKR